MDFPNELFTFGQRCGAYNEDLHTGHTYIEMPAEEATEYSICEHYMHPRDLTGFQTHALKLVGYEEFVNCKLGKCMYHVHCKHKVYSRPPKFRQFRKNQDLQRSIQLW
jgi:hypothetical protein